MERRSLKITRVDNSRSRSHFSDGTTTILTRGVSGRAPKTPADDRRRTGAVPNHRFGEPSPTEKRIRGAEHELPYTGSESSPSRLSSNAQSLISSSIAVIGISRGMALRDPGMSDGGGGTWTLWRLPRVRLSVEHFFHVRNFAW